MKRNLFVIFSMLLMMLASCQKELVQTDELIFKVSPTELEFNAKKGSKDITIKTSSKPWEITIADGSEWVRPERLTGRFTSTIAIYVEKNETGKDRIGSFNVTTEGCDPITVNVKQGATNLDPSAGQMKDIYPDPESGIYVEPKKPNPDEPCTIHFKAPASSPLYGTTSDLYVHTGIISDQDWLFVQADWDENIDKCKMTKVEENHWTLELTPNIREYYGSGETPVVRLAIVIRNEDGSLKAHPDDQFNSCDDKKYVFVPFAPDDVVVESMPSNVKEGINYNDDKSVTFVLYDKDKNGAHHDYCYLTGEFSGWERQKKYMMKRDNATSCWWYTLSSSEIEPGKEYMFQYHLGDIDEPDKHFRIADAYSEIIYDGDNDRYISTSTYPNLPEYPKGAKGLVGAFQVDAPEYNWQHSDFKVADANDLVIYEMLLRDFTATGDLNGAMDKLDYIANLGVNAIELMPVQEFDGNDSWGYNPNHYCAMDKAYGTRDMYKKFIDACHAKGIAVIFDVVYNHATGAHPFARLYWDKDKTKEANPWFNVTAPHGFSVFQDWNHTEPMSVDHIERTLRYLIEEYHIDGFRFDLSKGFTQNSGTESKYDQQRVDILKNYNKVIKEANPDAIVILEHFVDDENVELGKAGMKVWRNCNHAYIESGKGGNSDFSYLRDGYEPFGTCVGFMESHDEERVAYEQKTVFSPGSALKWGLCGTMTNWGQGTAGKVIPDIEFVEDGNLLAIRQLKLTTADSFKVRAGNAWEHNYGTTGQVVKINEAYALQSGGADNNLSVPKAGTYDIYFHPESARIWIIDNGSKPVVKDAPNTALAKMMKRGALNAAFFLTVPGPKMIWQFGEFGYDVSIEDGGRTAKKPVHWEYLNVPERKELHDVYAELLRFRKENPRFFDMDAHFEWYVSKSAWPCKSIFGSVDGKNFAIIGNFSQVDQDIKGFDLKGSGNWRNWFNPEEKFSGSSVDVQLKGNEFRMYVNF